MHIIISVSIGRSRRGMAGTKVIIVDEAASSATIANDAIPSVRNGDRIRACGAPAALM